MSTVHILGAGASAGYDRSFTGMRCPSAKNFFSVAQGIIGADLVKNRESFKNIVNFLKEYFNLSFSDIEEAGLDMQDVLTFLDLEIDYSDSEVELDMLRRARHEFMNLLTITFNNVLQGPPCPYHAALAAGLGEGDAVISFNYDLLMDTALFHNNPLWNPETGYGFLAASRENRQVAPSAVYLLKPHGSFNWISCSTCGNIYVLPPTQSGVPVNCNSLRSLVPNHSEHRLDRLIIPPSLKKDVHGRVMQQIWMKAHQALKDAGRIVIIGYSLPAADFLVKRLLYRSVSINGNLRELEVVDRNNSESSSPLIKKYKQLLYNSKKQIKLVYDKRNLSEYAACRKIH
ncbi:MAG: hypothetical protein M1130_06030 [Actinobacteria bacterium]|nr:hypothetical protein [Actinomycetota bacterium]